MMRLRIIITGLVLCLGIQELGAAFPAVFEQTIEYAKDGSEVKEEFVCESVKRIDAPAESSPSVPAFSSCLASKSHNAVRLACNRIILFRSLRI